jgi:fucose permease
MSLVQSIAAAIAGNSQLRCGPGQRLTGESYARCLMRCSEQPQNIKISSMLFGLGGFGATLIVAALIMRRAAPWRREALAAQMSAASA